MVRSLTLEISKVSFFFDIVAVLLANCVGRKNKRVSVTYNETVTVANRVRKGTDWGVHEKRAFRTFYAAIQTTKTTRTHAFKSVLFKSLRT